MRDDAIDPEDEDEDADVEEEEEDVEEDDDDNNVIGRRMSSSSSSIAGLHNVSNTCYLNATVQVCICISLLLFVTFFSFFLSSSRGPIQPTLYREMFLDDDNNNSADDDDDTRACVCMCVSSTTTTTTRFCWVSFV